ncbi:hypothetical protein [Marinifilum sp. D714]|nr:hypothetical protein [Marinifilum sp. D714]MDQ2178555.1 hypothetical protein [Marinifilum sp. D714]
MPQLLVNKAAKELEKGNVQAAAQLIGELFEKEENPEKKNNTQSQATKK